jgi:3-phenylpropionate/trans-cinnamate dioxygenase ferredoxin subunit
MPVPATSDAPWSRVAADADLPDECAVRVQVDDVPVCLARSRGHLHAIIERCTHEDVPLSEGDVEDGVIECYMHGSRFDLETGNALNPPAVRPVTVFPVMIDEGDVFVCVAVPRPPVAEDHHPEGSGPDS